MCERMAGQNIRYCSGVLFVLAEYVPSLPELSGSSSIEEHLVINVTVCLCVLSVFGVVMTVRSFPRAAIPPMGYQGYWTPRQRTPEHHRRIEFRMVSNSMVRGELCLMLTTTRRAQEPMYVHLNWFQGLEHDLKHGAFKNCGHCSRRPAFHWIIMTSPRFWPVRLEFPSHTHSPRRSRMRRVRFGASGTSPLCVFLARRIFAAR